MASLSYTKSDLAKLTMSKQLPRRALSISDVERESGIPKETLRVWERRYSFPTPSRDANGDRIYTDQQLIRLQLIKRLVDQGFRPGKVVQLEREQLVELAARAGQNPAGPAADVNAELQDECLAMIAAHQTAELRQALMQAQLRLGLRAFVTALVAPLTIRVGNAWAAGQLAVFEEHMFSETLQGVLRSAINTAGQQNDRALAAPRILLTTVPAERHGLGLLMAEALFALEGAYCISLGVQTPLADIVTAARVHRADIVALSFSSLVAPRIAIENVTQLITQLDGSASVWCGGTSAAALAGQFGEEAVLDLEGIPAAVERWRARHGGRMVN